MRHNTASPAKILRPRGRRRAASTLVAKAAGASGMGPARTTELSTHGARHRPRRIRGTAAAAVPLFGWHRVVPMLSCLGACKTDVQTQQWPKMGRVIMAMVVVVIVTDASAIGYAVRPGLWRHQL